MEVDVLFKKLIPEAIIPAYQSKGASGMDLHSVVSAVIGINQIKIIHTGISIAIPEGYEGQVRPRSGLAAKGITVLNTPGTIDADYRGEIKVILINLGQDVVHVQLGDRIAQLVIMPVVRANVQEVLNLDQTERGGNGFGSTGIR